MRNDANAITRKIDDARSGDRNYVVSRTVFRADVHAAGAHSLAVAVAQFA
jgi:hypothetical protein